MAKTKDDLTLSVIPERLEIQVFSNEVYTVIKQPDGYSTETQTILIPNSDVQLIINALEKAKNALF